MLARGDFEFDIFEKMDEERYERDGIKPKVARESNYRLMNYEDVPDWVKVPNEPKKVITELGKRKRHKNKTFNNFDHLDDEDYFRILEEKFGDYDDRAGNTKASDSNSQASGYNAEDIPMSGTQYDQEDKPRKKKRLNKGENGKDDGKIKGDMDGDNIISLKRSKNKKSDNLLDADQDLQLYNSGNQQDSSNVEQDDDMVYLESENEIYVEE